MRRFYAAPNQFTENEVHLSLEESRHLRDVLRLREGDEVSVFDGDGREFLCRIESTGNGKTVSVLKIISQLTPPSPESNLDLALVIALLKGEKFDLVIQKATELGVNKIIPLQTKRADVKINQNEAPKKLERWKRIALEAAKQSGRARVPEIIAPLEFEKFVKEKHEYVVFFSERGGESLDTSNINSSNITAVVGPEGGWDDSEITLAKENGFQIVTLGGRIMRAETAAMVVTALLQNRFGDVK
jgi:16S rRNA (uracil1498-N3)-methyltransferase